MIYKFRVWFSAKLFIWGRDMHPDIIVLKKQIKEQQERANKLWTVTGGKDVS